MSQTVWIVRKTVTDDGQGTVKTDEEWIEIAGAEITDAGDLVLDAPHSVCIRDSVSNAPKRLVVEGSNVSAVDA